jgi:hypothetical protein
MNQPVPSTRDVVETAIDLSKEDGTWSALLRRVIASRRVVSAPNAAIKVTEYTLTPEAKAALTLNVREFPRCK